MCTTLHLVLRDRHPHELRDLYTTITHIPGIHHNPWSPHHSPPGVGHPLPPRVIYCLEEASEIEPLTVPLPSTTVRNCSHMLLTHTHEEFATLASLQKDHTRPPCRYVSGLALLRPSQIHHYIYGEWQGILEIQECLDGIFKILQLDPAVSLL